MKLTIATANSRKSIKWKNIDTEWETLAKKLMTRFDTYETAEEYERMTKEQKGEVKDVGGFVGGFVRGGKRVKGAIAYRSLLTLDIDKATKTTAKKIKNLFKDYNFVVYSTHSHTEKSPRLRLVMPLSVTLDDGMKYEAFGRYIADCVGIETIDGTTFQMERLMYYPSSSKGAEFVSFGNVDKENINPVEILASKYVDYRNTDEWAKTKEEESQKKQFKPNNIQHTENAERKMIQDPTEKNNIVGDFCKVYDIHKAISKFLPNVYQQNDARHYTYANGSGSRGLVVLDDGAVAYSHHSTDPAHGRGLNAFDLVRVHLFEYLDNNAHPNTKLKNLPSMQAMAKLIEKDTELKTYMITQKAIKDFGDFYNMDFEEVKTKERQSTKEEKTVSKTEERAKEKQPEEWLVNIAELLDINKDGAIRQTAKNLDLLINNDPTLKDAIYFDEFANKRIITQSLPWREIERPTGWTDEDEAGLRGYLETKYGITQQNKTTDAITRAFANRKKNPPLEFIQSAKWDGVPRVDTLFIDYLGAKDTPLIRELTRKTLVACVARILSPGIKYDQITVFVGREGIGKSTMIKALGREWYSDSLHTLEGKDAMEQISGAWLVELAELQALKKTEITAVKAFVSKQSDRYRPAYARNSVEIPRQCVFFATTNEQTFLKNETGNRRFWTIAVGEQESKKKPFDLVNNVEEVKQIYAEAVEMYRKGEPLYLDEEFSALLIKEQEDFEIEDDRANLLDSFLDIPIPEDWDDWNIADRVEYYKELTERNAMIPGTHAYKIKDLDIFGVMPNGYRYRTSISIPEIKIEFLGIREKDLGNMRESREISMFLSKNRKWKRVSAPRRLKRYGLQKVWDRDSYDDFNK